MRGDEPLKLKPKQLDFCDWNRPSRFRYWQGGFGAHKSTTICAGAIELCMLYPKNRWLIGRQHFTDLKDSTMNTFFQTCPPAAIKNYNKADHRATLINDSEVLFEGCEDWEKFKSYELGGFSLDESNQIEKNCFLLLTSRIGRVPSVPIDMCFGLMASNPPTIDHWLHHTFAKNPDPLFEQFLSSTRENIANATSEGEKKFWEQYVANLERVYAHDPQMVEVLIDGRYGFVMGSKRVYPEFNPGIHCGNFKPIEGKPIFRTWDFGYNHPACLWSQFDNNDRLIHLYEDLGKDVIISRYRDHIIERTNTLFSWHPYVIDYCDWAGTMASDKEERTSIEYLWEKGIRPRHIKFSFTKARDAVGDRMTRLIDGKPALLVNNACQILIEGYKGGFRFPQTPEGRAEKDYPLQDGYYEHLNDCDLILNANLGLPGSRKLHFDQPKVANSYGSSRIWP